MHKGMSLQARLWLFAWALCLSRFDPLPLLQDDFEEE
jgi:hypothetical protein